ncbi:mastermind-like protein 1 [Rhinatrema bivittatum]|uniref:mastermind-like protein 1 n=1 Tax=Rhinatrema bivittatum TaxID=194408 RepID=UPI0011264B7D|nr:mastermind-like protein 1 [Rhinatrema bivittatum]
MADFVVPRHSAVMERLRRRIELCRRHHGSCEARYEAGSSERLELERQHTFALHQRCLQAKAKRAGKHRQQQPSSTPADPGGLRGSLAAGTNGLEVADSSGEQSRNSNLIAQLHETVKRKLDSAASPQNGDQQNGYGDIYSVSKKLRHEDGLGGVGGSSNGMPPVSPLHQLDNKPPNGDALQLNGAHSLGLDSINKKCLPDSNLQLNGSSDRDDGFTLCLNKELKQEPVDDLPCMLAGAGGSMSQNNLMPDLNLNEQEWKELIEELNRSVPDEDMKDLFNEDFEEKKDPDSSNSTTQTALAQDIHIKTEFSPATFEQEQMGSPQVRSTSSGASFMGASSVPASSASPVVGNSQAMFQSSQAVTETPNQTMMQASNQPPNVQRTLPSVLISGQATGTAKEMSSSHQLQQIAAKQKRDQLLQNQQQVHQSNPMPSWPQSGPSQSPLSVAYNMEKPSSPSVYQPDFNNPKLMMPNMANKSSPRASGNYLQPNHVNIMTHQPSSLNQNPVSGQSSMLDYGNTKPLSHYKEDCGPGISAQSQNKAPMLAYLQQQQRSQPQLPHMSEEQNQLFLMKQKAGIAYRPMVPHSQDQKPSPSVSRVPVSVPGPGVGTQPPVVSMAGNHSNAVYLNSQQRAVVMKQHQMLLDRQKQREQQQKQQQMLIEHQKQFLLGQRQQQLLAEQEKRHQQEQQLQRHLTRPPPQYQDQTQNAYQQQQQVGQFPGSSPAMPGVNNLGQSNSSSPRMFSQTQSLIQMGPGHTAVPSVPSGSSQQDRSVPQYSSGMQSVQRGAVYNMAPGITQMVPTHTTQGTITNGQPQMQRQPSLGQGTAVSTAYAQNTLANSNLAQQHSKGTLNTALSKPQMARVPAAMAAPNPSWQQQGLQTINNQAQGNNSLGPFNATAGFHIQQNHLKMASQQFTQGMPQVGLGTNRPMASMNSTVPGQMISSLGAQQRTNPPSQQPTAPQQVMASLNQPAPDMTAFSQAASQQMANRTNLHCSQSYQVRVPSQELSFAYTNQSGSSGLQNLSGETDLIDSLLKNRTSEEWMNDLDELLGSH